MSELDVEFKLKHTRISFAVQVVRRTGKVMPKYLMPLLVDFALINQISKLDVLDMSDSLLCRHMVLLFSVGE